MFDDSLRLEAEENCKDMQDLNDQKEAKKDDSDKVVNQNHVEAHIDCTDDMLDKLHAKDVDG